MVKLRSNTTTPTLCTILLYTSSNFVLLLFHVVIYYYNIIVIIVIIIIIIIIIRGFYELEIAAEQHQKVNSSVERRLLDFITMNNHDKLTRAVKRVVALSL